MKINGEVVRALRERDGKTGAQFASELGISPQFLSDIERGRRNSRPNITKQIADALKTPITTIIVAENEAVA